MLNHLELHHVGPAADTRMDLAPRLNLITGDNGLGKSFLLDLAWWALTRSWAGYPARPRGDSNDATIKFAFTGKSKVSEYVARFDRARQEWKGAAGRPANPGLVLYAQVDGGFALWDPARSGTKQAARAEYADRPSYVFRPGDVWNGLEHEGTTLCNGLIRDWASWQKERGRPFQLLKATLRVMSPSEHELLEPGDLTRISLDDVRDMPTLRMPYGEDTPIVQASAGMRRIAALVYLLVWAWEEHQRASTLLGQAPTQQVTFLVDELDTHLHPRWQRVVLRALLDVVSQLMTQGEADVQIVAATHSPLVLASVEPYFDEDVDALWHLSLRNGAVSLEHEAWAKQGDVRNWLVSETFGLRQARSLDAEKAIEAAEAFMRDDVASLPAGLRTKAAIHAELVRVLAGHDPFWPRWIVAPPVEASRKRKPASRSKASTRSR